MKCCYSMSKVHYNRGEVLSPPHSVKRCIWFTSWFSCCFTNLAGEFVTAHLGVREFLNALLLLNLSYLFYSFCQLFFLFFPFQNFRIAHHLYASQKAETFWSKTVLLLDCVLYLLILSLKALCRCYKYNFSN